MRVKCLYCNKIPSLDTKFFFAIGEFISDKRNLTCPRELGSERLEAPGYFKEIECKYG